MKFTPLPDWGRARRWRCRKGFWSFLIMQDEGVDEYYCTYRDMRIPMSIAEPKAIGFHGDRELTADAGTILPRDFAYATLTEAVSACHAKYKQIIIR